MDDKKQPIIVKKVVKGGGHHGGAWKVAYADFVTAMMAFFLLLWLLGSTTKEQKAAISDYFQNPSAVQGPGGASTSMIDLGGVKDMTQQIPTVAPDEQMTEEMEQELEKKRLESLLEELKETIEQGQALKPFKDQLLLDITPEGLRIQIVDKENRSMFDVGSDTLQPYAVQILHEIAAVINQVPNRISITGHTDARPYVRRDYTNWELSADRANAARRALMDGGMREDKIGRVVGLASSVLFDKAQPFSPVNRRISIIVMTKATEAAIQHDGVPMSGPANTGAAAQKSPIPEEDAGKLG